MVPWTIIVTKPGAEEIAAKSIRQAGNRSLLLTYRKIYWPHGRDRPYALRMLPLLPSYVFVQDWRGFAQPVSGTVGPMRMSGEIAVMGDEEVMGLWRKEMAGAFDEPRPGDKRARRPDLTIGGAVAFDFHGSRIEAIIEGLSGSGKAIIRNMLGIKMTVDERELELV